MTDNNQRVNEQAEMLPCPFCGGTDIRIDEHRGQGRVPGENVYSMCCYKCGATFPNRYRRHLMVESWNRRADIEQRASSAPTDDALPYVEGWSLPRDLATAHAEIKKLRLAYAEQVMLREQAAPEAPAAASVKPRDILAICDAYESGIGHGLQQDGHRSGAMFGNCEHGKAYEIGYAEGEDRAQQSTKEKPHG